MSGTPLVLASSSPRRRAILEQIGVAFEVDGAEVEEIGEGEPREIATQNALRKARAVAPRHPGAMVLGADTVVASGDRVLGKPGGEQEARAFLELLSGSDHVVWSGVVVCDSSGERSLAVATAVGFRELSPVEIDWYVASEEWRDKAGGYAIQGRGAALVAGIEGDYLNVVGLPVAALLDLMPGLLHPE